MTDRQRIYVKVKINCDRQTGKIRKVKINRDRQTQDIRKSEDK